LKILIFVEHFASPTETFIYQHVKGFSDQHEVVVLCMKRSNEERFPYSRVQVIPYLQSRWLKTLRNRSLKHHITLNFHHAEFKHSLNLFIQGFQPDIIHCHFGDKAFFLLDNINFAYYKGPIFVTFHGVDATKKVKNLPAYRRRLKSVLTHSQVFPIAVSQFMINYLKSHKLPTHRFRVVHSGVDVSYFKPHARKPQTTQTLLQIAGFRPKKGHQSTIMAFAKLLKRTGPSCQLVFGGSGETEEPCKKLVFELGIHEQVTFLGWVSQERTRMLLEEADLFIYPSIVSNETDMEGIPVAIMEAMAMELPIFSTWHAGIPELVTHRENGLLAPENDVDAYVECMSALLAWKRLPINRQKIIDQFSQTIHINRLKAAYTLAIKHCKMLS
jgi:colanic acid/amylovoran biosynthesis glycosyltransferase